jgi:hypothetical protein
MMQLPSTTDVFVCDIIPYMHPTHSGRFIFRPDLACAPPIMSWFTARVRAGVDQLARDGSYPVLYVVDEVWFVFVNSLCAFFKGMLLLYDTLCCLTLANNIFDILDYLFFQVWKACFHKWPIPKDDVEGLEGVVFRATICGIAVLLIHGVHPSPRSVGVLSKNEQTVCR